MAKKLKGCRPTAEINQEYTTVCAQLGNFTFRRGLFAREIERLNKRLTELDLEAGAAAQQEQAIAAEVVADDAPPQAAEDHSAEQVVGLA